MSAIPRSRRLIAITPNPSEPVQPLETKPVAVLPKPRGRQTIASIVQPASPPRVSSTIRPASPPRIASTIRPSSPPPRIASSVRPASPPRVSSTIRPASPPRVSSSVIRRDETGLVPYSEIMELFKQGLIFDFAVNVTYRSIDNNVRMGFIDNRGNTFESIVRWVDTGKKDEKSILEPTVSSLEKINHMLEEEKVHMDNLELEELSEMVWEKGKSFEDLQALNLMFLRGLLYKTPYHLGPLDPESNIIISELFTLNLKGLITNGSQPFEKFFVLNEMTYQRPYLEFFFLKSEPKNQILFDRLKFFNPDSLILQIDLQTREIKRYLSDNAKLLSRKGYYSGSKTLKVENGIAIWSEDFNTSFPIDYDDEMINSHIEMFGSNFTPLVRSKLSWIFIVSNRLDNKMFSELIPFL